MQFHNFSPGSFALAGLGLVALASIVFPSPSPVVGVSTETVAPVIVQEDAIPVVMGPAIQPDSARSQTPRLVTKLVTIAIEASLVVVLLVAMVGVLWKKIEAWHQGEELKGIIRKINFLEFLRLSDPSHNHEGRTLALGDGEFLRVGDPDQEGERQ